MNGIKSGQENMQKFKKRRPLHGVKKEDFKELSKLIGWNKFTLSRFKTTSLDAIDRNLRDLPYLEQIKQIHPYHYEEGKQIKLLLSSYSLSDLPKRTVWISQPESYNFFFDGEKRTAFDQIHKKLGSGMQYWLSFAISGPREVFQIKQIDYVSSSPFFEEQFEIGLRCREKSIDGIFRDIDV